MTKTVVAPVLSECVYVVGVSNFLRLTGKRGSGSLDTQAWWIDKGVGMQVKRYWKDEN